jgi:hypothetical protein
MQEPRSLLLSSVQALARDLRGDEVAPQTVTCLQELLPTLRALWCAPEQAPHTSPDPPIWPRGMAAWTACLFIVRPCGP